MLDVSVVINTRDQPDGLRLCLAALESQSLPAHRWEVIIVDDGSRDDAATMLAESYSGRSRCQIVRREHTGRGAARNAGVEAARGRYILFLGDDVLGAPDLLEQHLRAHERWLQVAVIGLYEWTPECPSQIFRQWVDNCRFWDIRDPQNATFRFFYTGNASIERQALLDIGGFDENFALYGWEDIDLGFRLEKSGLRIVYYPKAYAVHNHPHVSLKALCRREYEMGFSAAYFFEKWHEEPEIQEDRFWEGEPADLRVGAPWRKALGRGMIRVAERLCPIPALLRALYSRFIWSYRFQGVREGAAHYGPVFERWRAGELPENERANRFQMTPAPASSSKDRPTSSSARGSSACPETAGRGTHEPGPASPPR